jgi:hypothetical protein
VQAVEVRPAIDAQQHGLTIDHEGRIAVAQRGFRNQRISDSSRGRPWSTAHALAITLDDQPIAVVLDLVKPLGAVRHLDPATRDAGFKRGFQHRRLDIDSLRKCESGKQIGAGLREPDVAREKLMLYRRSVVDCVQLSPFERL